MHEIASHGYTYSFSSLTDEEVTEEMKLIKDWSLKMNSIVRH